MKKLLALLFLFCASTAHAQWQTPVGSIPVGRGPGVQGFNTVGGSAGGGTKCLLDSVPPAFGACNVIGGGIAIGTTGVSGGSGNDVLYNNAGTLAGVSPAGTGALCLLNTAPPTFGTCGGTVSTIAAMKALTGGAYPVVKVLGYYAVLDNGGGDFQWNSASTTADNGGSIIAPNAGGTGRWIRQTAIPNQYTPEMFGAKHDGTDDYAYFNNLMTYLGGLTNGGQIQLSCGTVYTLGTISSNGLSVINPLSNVNINGCGDTSTIKIANGVNTSAAFFAYGIYHTSGNLNNVRYSNFTMDMNGVNNSCSATCWHSNAAIGAYNGNDIAVENVRFINNPGSNDIVFGTNAQPPTVTNLRITGTVHEHSGDAINAASTDFSGIFFIASNVTLANSRFSDGPRVNGSAFEIHGTNVSVSNLSVTDYFNCGIIANEVASPVVNNITIGNVACNNVKGGIQLYSRAGANSTNINMDAIQVKFLSGSSGMGIDACSNIDAATTLNLNLSVTNSNIYSDVTTNLGNDGPGICVGRWASVKINNNQTYNTQGPGIQFIAQAANAALEANSNQIYSPGRTNNTALQAGIVVTATGGITVDVINIQNNTTRGASARYGILGAQNAVGGLIMGNTAPSATVGQYSYTGTGVTVLGLPAASTTLAGLGTTQTWTAPQTFQANSINTNTNMCFSVGNSAAIAAGNTYYFTYGYLAGTESVVALPVSAPGTAKNMYAATNSAAGVGQTYTMTLRKNGVDQAMTCTMANTTACNNTSNTFAITGNDQVSVKLVVSGGAATAAGMNVCFTLVTTSP